MDLIEKKEDDTPKQSDRAHTRLSALLQRRGIEGMDPNTDEGKYIGHKIFEYLEMSSKSLPDTARDKLIRMAVEAEILKNSCVTTLLTLRPKPGTTEKAKAEREVFRATNAAYKTYVSILMSIIKTLTTGDQSTDTPETFEERMNRLK